MWKTLKKLWRGKGPPPAPGFGSLRETASDPDPAGSRVDDLVGGMRRLFQGADDVRFRTVRVGKENLEATFIFIDGLVDENRIEGSVLRPLLDWASAATEEQLSRFREDIDYLPDKILSASEVGSVGGLEEAAATILQGDVVFAFQGAATGLEISNRGWHSRSVEAPKLEPTIRGPQDGFTENLLWNTALLRRRIRDPHLRIELMKIGRRSRTDVALVHIEGITPKDLVDEVRSRLESIDIDGILDTGYIEHLIEDAEWSPFPHHLKSERPDAVASALLEGRAAVFADTTPFVLMMPATFDSMFHSPEDSYDRWFPVNLLRWVRFLAAVMSVTMPALYVSLVAYHPGILPTEFLLHVMASREGVAFPVVVEALLMQFFLELIKEAGFRMPSPIGQTFGIVGGLILGDIGVRAGIVSEAMVIVVAITAVSSFAAVDREIGTVLRLLGLPVMLAAAAFGLYGLVMSGLLIMCHLTILRSYGVPFIVPYPYYDWSDIKDSLIRVPLRSFRKRPSIVRPRDRVRQGRSDPSRKGE